MLNMLQSAKKKLKDKKFILMAFGFCLMVTIAGYIYMGIYPFGKNSVLQIDLYHQYAPFHEELRNKLLTGSSLFYSWEGGLGKNFIAQFAYYTASPLNILLIFFKQETIPAIMGYFILIKIGFCGAFFAHYLRERFKKDGVQIIIFSIFYGVSAYITAYYWNVMWLDAVAIFPLVALGIHRIIDKGKYKTYLFSLAACIIVNFYIAFLVCIFSVMYFIVFLFCKYSITDWKNYIKPLLTFGICSLLAGGIAMFLILPSYHAITNTAVYSASFPTDIHVNFNILDYLTTHFWGVTPRVMVKNESLPNVYCGILTVILFPFYYTDKKTPIKEKILTSVFLVVIFFGFYINAVNFLFHGLHFPACMPHRFSFIYIFIIISVSYKSFINIKHISVNQFVICGIIFAVYIFISERIIIFADSDVILDNKALIINFVFIFIYSALLIMFKLKFLKRSYLNFLLCVTVIEFSMSAIVTLPHKGSTEIDNYTKYMSETKEIVSYLESINDNFYRTEFFRFQTTNDSALLHFRGMTQFSSTANGNTTKLMERIGISATSNSNRYYDPTQLINAMFSIKYIIYKDNIAYENVNEKIDLNYIETFGELSTYENQYWLPLGYSVDKEILNWNTSDYNPFLVQNDFIEKAAGISEEMFTPFPIVSTTLRYADITGNSQEGLYSYKLQNEKNLQFVPEFKAIYKNPSDQHVFLYVDSPNSLVVTVQVENAVSNRDFSTGRGTIDIGFVKAGTDIIVSFTLDRRGDDEKTYRPYGTIKVLAAGYDRETFIKAYDHLNANTLNVEEFTDTTIKGSIEMTNEGVLLTSIPYDAGWKIYVNGTLTESINFQNNALIALSLKEGIYDIEWRFTPYGLNIGVIISIISVGAIIIYEIIRKRLHTANIH